MSNRPPTTAASPENGSCTVENPTLPNHEVKKKQQQRQPPRQLLSCTKCRERKVKCDRTKPCSACCARGQPKECHFIAEGGDYTPIQQSYELRKLRAENIRLKERLRASRLSSEEEEDPSTPLSDVQLGEGSTSRFQTRRGSKQQQFQSPEWTESIYFGSPGLANVIKEFASLNVGSGTSCSAAHLAYGVPRGADIYAPRDLPLYPFATLFSWSLEECIPQLLHCLPPKAEIFEYLDTFQKRVHVCSFPHIPTEITHSEVARFLADARRNTEKCPDMLALLFATLALGSQHSVWDKCGHKWIAGAMEEESKKGNLYIAAAMHALRMASFMNRPTLLGIQALVMIGPYLTNSGRFLDAWTLFGTTIRLAQSIGLHRNPRYMDPAPSTQQECHVRQWLWWWMLHMDQNYSMTLGRPLGISGIGDCPPPYELTTDQTLLRFGEYVNQFTILARHVLGSERLSTAKIDEFTDSLLGLLETLPESLQFDESWLAKGSNIPDWPLGAMAAVMYCQTHTYILLLNRQRLERKQEPPGSRSGPVLLAKTPPSQSFPGHRPDSTRTSPATLSKPDIRGRPLVLSSCGNILTAFLFLHMREPATLICWNVCQQAFNACMILLLDAIETGYSDRLPKVEEVYAVFVEMNNKSVHKLARLAVEKIRWGFEKLKRSQKVRQRARSESGTLGRGHHGTGDVVMQDVPAKESKASSRASADPLMGNTGMHLLEDPGLQSFTQGAFSPFTWIMSGDNLDGKRTAPTMQEDTPSPRSHSSPSGRGVKSESRTAQQDHIDLHPSQSREHWTGVQTLTHGVRSTPGSERLRYTTVSSPVGPTAAKKRVKQPRTTPRATTATTNFPPFYSNSNSRKTQVQKETRAREMASEASPLSQGRHQQSYAELQQSAPLGLQNTDMRPDGRVNLDHGFASLAGPPYGLPGGDQEMDMQYPSVHSSWGPRAAGPGPDPTMGFSPTVNHGQGVYGLGQHAPVVQGVGLEFGY